MEARLTGVFLFLLLVCLPVATVAAGWTAYDWLNRLARTQSAERHQVDARVVAERAPGEERGSGSVRDVPVRWTEQDGTVRTDTVRMSEEAATGSAVRLWVDRSGEVTRAPLSTEGAVSTAVGAALLTAAAGGVALHRSREGARRALDRRRYAQWEAEWATLEPQWTGRRSA